MTAAERPERPPPLDVTSEESKAAWRAYLHGCAIADNPAFDASATVREIMMRRLVRRPDH